VSVFHPEVEKPTTVVHSQVPVKLRDELAAIADREYRSLSAQIRFVLAEHVEREREEQ